VALDDAPRTCSGLSFGGGEHLRGAGKNTPRSANTSARISISPPLQGSPRVVSAVGRFIPSAAYMPLQLFMNSELMPGLRAPRSVARSLAKRSHRLNFVICALRVSLERPVLIGARPLASALVQGGQGGANPLQVYSTVTASPECQRRPADQTRWCQAYFAALGVLRPPTGPGCGLQKFLALPGSLLAFKYSFHAAVFRPDGEYVR
jgi:hypothetical protein